jgi:hypothetical protein
MRIVQLMTDRSRHFNPSKNYLFSFNAFLNSLIDLYFQCLSFRVVQVNTARPDEAFLFVVWFIHWKRMIRPFLFRDRLFHLQGGLWFLVSFRIFFSDNTRVRMFLLLSRKARIFFPEFNIRLYDKNSESDYFFFLHQNQNILFSNIGNQNICLEKKHTPPLFKLNGRSLIEKTKAEIVNTWTCLFLIS